jgi:hypothetical protein
MVPRGIGNAGLWVSVTGVAEVAIAIGLQIPSLARWTAVAVIIMLCCLFPANVKAAREHLTILQRPVLDGSAKPHDQANCGALATARGVREVCVHARGTPPRRLRGCRIQLCGSRHLQVPQPCM